MIEKFDIPVYKHTIIFAVGATASELHEFLKSNNNCSKEEIEHVCTKIKDEHFEHAAGVCVNLNIVGATIIWAAKDVPLLPEIVHESLHAVDFIADKIGIVYSADSIEFFTYLQTYIFTQCWELYKSFINEVNKTANVLKEESVQITKLEGL